MKELQISPAIDPHDLAVKRDHAIQFLCDDHEGADQAAFQGRQKAHKEIGFEVVNKFVKEVAAYGQADSPPKMLGDRDLNVVSAPLPRDKRAKNPRQTPRPRSSSRLRRSQALHPRSEASLGLRLAWELNWQA